MKAAFRLFAIAVVLANCSASLTNAESGWCSSHTSELTDAGRALAIPLPSDLTINGATVQVSRSLGVTEDTLWLLITGDTDAHRRIANSREANRHDDYVRACKAAFNGTSQPSL
jgi:hypothetical protein